VQVVEVELPHKSYSLKQPLTATFVSHRYADDIAAVWCEWVEMELRHQNFRRALDLVKRATVEPPRTRPAPGTAVEVRHLRLHLQRNSCVLSARWWVGGGMLSALSAVAAALQHHRPAASRTRPAHGTGVQVSCPGVYTRQLQHTLVLYSWCQHVTGAGDAPWPGAHSLVQLWASSQRVSGVLCVCMPGTAWAPFYIILFSYLYLDRHRICRQRMCLLHPMPACRPAHRCRQLRSLCPARSPALRCTRGRLTVVAVWTCMSACLHRRRPLRTRQGRHTSACTNR
jgi:hypothetical protein